jgi:hypothetical protein
VKLYSFAYVRDLDDPDVGINLSVVGPDGYSIHSDVYPTINAAYEQAKAILRDAGYVELGETPVETTVSTPAIGADPDGPIQVFLATPPVVFAPPAPPE